MRYTAELRNLHGCLILQGDRMAYPQDLWIHSSTNFHQNYTKVRSYTCTWFGPADFSKRDKIVIISWDTSRFYLPYHPPNLFGVIKLLNLSMEILWHMINNNLVVDKVGMHGNTQSYQRYHLFVCFKYVHVHGRNLYWNAWNTSHFFNIFQVGTE